MKTLTSFFGMLSLVLMTSCATVGGVWEAGTEVVTGTVDSVVGGAATVTSSPSPNPSAPEAGHPGSSCEPSSHIPPSPARPGSHTGGSEHRHAAEKHRHAAHHTGMHNGPSHSCTRQHGMQQGMQHGRGGDAPYRPRQTNPRNPETNRRESRYPRGATPPNAADPSRSR